MHTTGTVCVLRARSTYSTWIIESPRWVSHSVQAWTQDWQPMQRLGSMKNWRWPGFIARSLLRLEDLLVGGRAVGAAEADRADLVLGDLADGILSRDGQLVGALRSRPVVGDEDRVRPDGGHHLGLEGHRAPARLRGGPVPVGDAQLLGEPRMQLDARLGVLLHQRADPPGLGAGEELTHDAAGGEDQRVLRVHILGGRTVLGDVEPRLSVREVEGAGALRDGVPAVTLEQPRRPRVVHGLAGLRILGVAGPEDPEVLLHLLPGDARVVRHAALAGHAQLLEHLPWALEREAALAAERPGEVLDDPPVLSSVSGRIHGLVDLDEPPLVLRHRYLTVLLHVGW